MSDIISMTIDQIQNNTNVYMHDCFECDDSYMRTCKPCLTGYKDVHSCNCEIVSYCKMCDDLCRRIENIKTNIAKLEKLNAPIQTIEMGWDIIKNMMDAMHSFEA